MPDFTPIPIPARLRWRHFRARYLPAIVFACAVVATILLWRDTSAPANMVGEVYAPSGIIAAPAAGILEGFDSLPFREVKRGEAIGSVRTIPQAQAEGLLGELRAEIAMIRLGAGEPVLEQQRNALAWHGLRRDWMLARSDLAIVRVRKRQAELDFRRYERLQGSGAAAETDYDRAKSLYDGLVGEEEEKEKLAQYLEEAVEESVFATGKEPPSLGESLAASLEWKEAELARLEEELKPMPLLAPLDGRITLVRRRAGDFVAAGEALAEISSTRPDFIIGYAKSPHAAALEVGMEVSVVPRGFRTGAAPARVLSVGPRFEALGAAFQRPLPMVAEERALPLLISLPDGVALRPGEIVDLRWEPPDA